MRILHHQLSHGRIAYQWSHKPCERPLIVLHGLGDSAIHTYAPKFASTVLHTVPSLFIDFPGFGKGSADAPYPATIEALAEAVADLLKTLGIQPSAVFAHSMGANVSLLLANQHPELISELILAEPLLDRGQSVLAAGIAKFSEEDFVDRGYAMLVRATSMQAHRGEIASIAFLPTIGMANPQSMHRAAVSLLEQRDPAFLEVLHLLTQRTHILVGENSTNAITMFEQADIPIKRVPGAGHFMFAEQSDATACAILNLVNGMHYGEPGTVEHRRLL